MKRVILADVEVGTIVRLRGEWGVVCKAGRGSVKTPRRKRVVDFWWGGREYVSDIAVVEVL